MWVSETVGNMARILFTDSSVSDGTGGASWDLIPRMESGLLFGIPLSS